MTALGKQGVKEMARQNISKAQYAKRQFEAKGFTVTFAGPFFNEFVVDCKRPVKEVNDALLQKNIIGGYDLGRDYKEHENHMLVAVTELRTKRKLTHL